MNGNLVTSIHNCAQIVLGKTFDVPDWEPPFTARTISFIDTDGDVIFKVDVHTRTGKVEIVDLDHEASVEAAA